MPDCKVFDTYEETPSMLILRDMKRSKHKLGKAINKWTCIRPDRPGEPPSHALRLGRQFRRI